MAWTRQLRAEKTKEAVDDNLQLRLMAWTRQLRAAAETMRAVDDNLQLDRLTA